MGRPTTIRPATTVELGQPAPVGAPSDGLRPLTVTATLGLAIMATAAWGSSVDGLHLGAAPFIGSWDGRFSIAVLAPVVVAGAVIAGAPRLVALPWKQLLVVASACSAAWAVSLAVVDGVDRLVDPLTTRWEHWSAVPLVGDPLRFLGSFVTDISTFPTHVRSHPPGTVLTFWSLDALGLTSPVWATALVIGTGAGATAAVLVTFREVAGESVARRAAPFLTLSPFFLWVATSADALYLGVGAAAVALLAMATSRQGWRGRGLALAGGVAAAGALFLSYGLLLLGVVPVAVAISRRRLDVLALGAIPIVLAGSLLATAGFWWWDGLHATRAEYWAGVASERPFSYFAVTNLVVAAVAVGPAVWGGLGQRLRGGTALLVGAAATAILVADLSGLSKGEVERIWLPFFPYLAVATAALPAGRHRSWLVVTALTGLVLQVTLRSPW